MPFFPLCKKKSFSSLPTDYAATLFESIIYISMLKISGDYAFEASMQQWSQVDILPNIWPFFPC